jgi:hypothetical protein
MGNGKNLHRAIRFTIKDVEGKTSEGEPPNVRRNGKLVAVRCFAYALKSSEKSHVIAAPESRRL